MRNEEPEYPEGKSLFVLNIPFYVNSNSLTAAFFRLCGPVRFCKFQSKCGCAKTEFKIAHIVFSNDLALEETPCLPKDFTIVLNTGRSLCTLGLQQWSKGYNSIYSRNETDFKDSIEKYMAGYDPRVEYKLTDENDGWTTVSSKTKWGQFAPTREESAFGMLHSIRLRQIKKKQSLNLYTSQICESKRFGGLAEKVRIGQKNIAATEI